MKYQLSHKMKRHVVIATIHIAHFGQVGKSLMHTIWKVSEAYIADVSPVAKCKTHSALGKYQVTTIRLAGAGHYQCESRNVNGKHCQRAQSAMWCMRSHSINIISDEEREFHVHIHTITTMVSTRNRISEKVETPRR